MPNELGIKQESFLVECRSLAGSSGSPVFVQWSIHDRLLPNGVPMFQKEGGPWLLGIVWGHLILVDPDFEYVRDNQGEILPEKLKVRVNTGIMQVVPAWKIREILDLPELQEKRRLEEVELVKQKAELLATLDAHNFPKELRRQIFPHLETENS
ncbi:MAG TPA: hypothetical protein VOA80_17460 [Thermoanaerobaculia bacterium]|nr:hypothetical protein [Thermoanaerobaculia bacterium]